MHLLSFDVGGSSIKFAVVTEQGEIKEKGKKSVPDTIEGFYQVFEETLAQCKSSYEIAGVACSFPGAVDDATGIIGGSSALDYIHDFPIRQALEERLKLPVSMENDANCAALGEAWLGAGKPYQDMLFIVIGTGIGGAVVKNKRIHQGRHLHGGEFGYMLIGDNTEIFSNTGSTRSLVERVEKAKGLPGGSLNGLKVFELLDEGDEDAAREVDYMYNQLARAIYNLQYAYDPEVFVLGGAVSEREGFAEEVMKKVEIIRASVKVARVKPLVLASKNGNDANILGAVYYYLNR